MHLKDVNVSSILDGGKNQKLWEKIRDKFVSKIQEQHKPSDDKVEKLEKMLMDKKVLKKAIADFKEIHKAGQSGGAKKKSRRRKKKKRAKKTKRRYRGGAGTYPPEIGGIFVMMGILGVAISLQAVWEVGVWGCNRLASAINNRGDNSHAAEENEAKNDVGDDEQLRREIQSSMTNDDSEPVTVRGAEYDANLLRGLPLQRRR